LSTSFHSVRWARFSEERLRKNFGQKRSEEFISRVSSIHVKVMVQ
jgi:hypothetical protein